MTPKQRRLMQKALDALEFYYYLYEEEADAEIIKELRDELAK